MRRTVTVLLALSAAVGLTGAGLAPASASSQLTFSVSQRVAVLARGGALAVPVTYTCPPRYGGSRGYAVWQIEVTQTVGSQVADGFNAGGSQAVLKCDGQSHQRELIVQPVVSLAYSAPGTGHVTALVLACNADETDCIQPAVDVDAALRTASAGDPANQPLNGSAQRQPDGSVRLTLPGTCRPGRIAFGNATLSQRLSGGRAAFLEGGSRLTCTGTTGRLLLSVDDLRARTGVAYVIGETRICTNARCGASHLFRGLVVIS
jgi:hypothetical protein